MEVKIVKSKRDGVYDVYNKENGECIFSRSHPDNVFTELAKVKAVICEFVDELLIDGTPISGIWDR